MRDNFPCSAVLSDKFFLINTVVYPTPMADIVVITYIVYLLLEKVHNTVLKLTQSQKFKAFENLQVRNITPEIDDNNVTVKHILLRNLKATYEQYNKQYFNQR